MCSSWWIWALFSTSTEALIAGTGASSAAFLGSILTIEERVLRDGLIKKTARRRRSEFKLTRRISSTMVLSYLKIIDLNDPLGTLESHCWLLNATSGWIFGRTQQPIGWIFEGRSLFCGDGSNSCTTQVMCLSCFWSVVSLPCSFGENYHW